MEQTRIEGQFNTCKRMIVFYSGITHVLLIKCMYTYFFQALMSSQCATMALQSCGYIPSCILSHYPAFLAVCGVLTSLIVHHTETIFKVIPTFISCANHILFTTNVFDRILIVSGHCVRKNVIWESTLSNLLNINYYDEWSNAVK